MKNIFKLLLSSLFVLTLLSCEEEITILQPKDGGHVQLASSDAIILTEASSSGTTLTLQLGIDENSDGYYADFEIVSDDNTRFIFTPSDSRAYFPPNTYETEVKITPVDNLVADGNINLTFNLTGSNSGVYGNEELKSIKITIQDNDCPTVIAEEYSLELSVLIFGSEYSTGTHSVELIPDSSNPNKFYIENLWGPDHINNFYALFGISVSYGAYTFPTYITLEDDFTVTFDVVNEGGASQCTVGGEGTYSACDDQWILLFDDACFVGFNGGRSKAILTKK